MSDEGPTGEGGSHALSIGYYIGALILVLGVIVTLTGVFGPTRPSEAKLGFDINLWGGLVMVLFGLAALGIARLTASRAQRSTPPRTPPPGRRD